MATLRCGMVLGMAVFAAGLLGTAADADEASPSLPGTEGWTLAGDPASAMIDGIDRFLLGQTEQSIGRRAAFWKRDLASPEAYQASVEPNRQRLAFLLGVRDPRIAFDAPELVATTRRPALVARHPAYEVYACRWPVLGNPRPGWTQSAIVHGEGLLLVPVGREPVADVVVLPDADQTPEQWAGLAEGLAPESQAARTLAERGCRVLVPALVSRTVEKWNGRIRLTRREYLYRSAYELGRHLIGYEVQKVLAAVDWFVRDAKGDDTRISVFGYGEGGWIALYAGALDVRIDAVCVSGAFDSRQTMWQEPVDRNVFGLLEQFGGAELATLVAPRPLVIETARGPELAIPGDGGAPGRLASPTREAAEAELRRASDLVPGMGRFLLAAPLPGGGPGSPESCGAFLAKLGIAESRPAEPSPAVERLADPDDPPARERRQIEEIDRFNQWLLEESPYVREAWFRKLDTSSPEKFRETIQPYRDYFAREVIGQFDMDLLPPHPRTRKAYDAAGWTGYEVQLDVFPDVFAYGILLMPKNIPAGERRPVVVCQHGLEGRPQDVLEGGSGAYGGYASKLAEEGFITFAPQNPYLFHDRFRTLQRKANPLKKTLFSVIVPQHRQIVAWLASLPQVDPARIGFYGLSYGGKSAMRIPALVDGYCLSICSADFNDWVWKNASTRSPYSYVWTGEYEIFEFDLGSTFNYAEMAALIAPRPFMVERGHFDGVAPDERVGYEFAKVRNLFAARLGLQDRAEIEWFVGPHAIHGVGTFEFLRKHLSYPPAGVSGTVSTPEAP